MTVEERLAAVERTLTGGEVEPAALSDAATVERRLDEVEERLDRLEDRIAGVEAGLDAVRGHVGDEQQAVDEIERTAATALSIARRMERRLDNPLSESEGRPIPETQSALSRRRDRGSGERGEPANGEQNDQDTTVPRRWLAQLIGQS